MNQSPPTFSDALNRFNQWHQQQYGTIIDRPWNSDPDAQAAKRHIDEQYLRELQAYNTEQGTNHQPEPGVLGENAQPNDYSRHRNRPGGILNSISEALGTHSSEGGLGRLGKELSSNPLINAALVAAGSVYGGPAGAAAVNAALSRAQGNEWDQVASNAAGAALGSYAVGQIAPGLSGGGSEGFMNTFAPAEIAAGSANPAFSLSGGTGTFGQGSTLATSNAMNAVPAAGMGGGAGLTLTSSTLPSIASMGGGTGVMAGGMSASGPVAGGTGANTGIIGSGLDLLPEGALNAAKALNIEKIIDKAPGILKAVGSIGQMLSGPGEQGSGTAPVSPAFNRPTTRWNQAKLAADAAAQNQSINEFMAKNWDRMKVGGEYTLAAGGRVSDGPLSQTARFVSEGGGSGRDDTVDARLSPDEYVIDAETTALLGDGSPREGARRLDIMRAEIRKHKGKNLAAGKISPNAKSPLAYFKESL